MDKKTEPLEARQIEDLYLEQDISLFHPIPLYLKFMLYFFLLLLVLFVASGFMIKINRSREYSIFLLSFSKSEKQIEFKLADSEHVLFKEGQSAVIMTKAGPQAVVIKKISQISDSFTPIFSAALSKDFKNDESFSVGAIHSLIVSLGEGTLLDVLFDSAE
ncbi:MAG: hypothetical protein JXR70_08435 [Spirochaetales bacterium]|nr:hypothetical protein [Spirochaetales bacterium]